jgi:hypothetical protein
MEHDPLVDDLPLMSMATFLQSLLLPEGKSTNPIITVAGRWFQILFLET